MGIFVAAIADDDTGATDLAGMLTEQGMRVVLLLEDVSEEQLARWTQACDAVVLGTASRSIPQAEAYARTAKAARTLRQLGPAVMAVKYCSTFDSTSEGNIGTSIDAAMDVTGATFTVALPALPALGRTTYMGYHFVGQQLLSDSTLRHHPLNPMTNPHLPSHLRTQTGRRVGLLAYPDSQATGDATREKLAAMQESGVDIAILDCVDDEHLQHLGEAISDLPLLTGSSAWAMVLPQLWREQGRWIPSSGNQRPTRTEGGSGFLMVSGSCSAATLGQNAWAKAQGIAVVELPALDVAQDAPPSSSIVAEVVATLTAGRPCLLSTTGISTKEEVHRAATQRGILPAAASERVGQLVADTVAHVFAGIQPQGLIVAGGETSSTLMRALGLRGLRVGPNIEPGVPVCVSLAAPSLGIALKSGNFGSVDFYARAIDAIRALPTRAVDETEEMK